MSDNPQDKKQAYADFISKQVRQGKVPGRPPEEKKPESK